MTRYIQRTVTITVIETLTLLWCSTNYDDQAPVLDTLTAAAPLLVCSINRVTSTVNTAILPPPTEEQK